MAQRKKTVKPLESPLEIVETPAQEAPEAKWIDMSPTPAKKCSVCGEMVCGWAYRTELKYCPFCGTKMSV